MKEETASRGERRRPRRRRFDLVSTKARRYPFSTLLSDVMHAHECANARSDDWRETTCCERVGRRGRR